MAGLLQLRWQKKLQAQAGLLSKRLAESAASLAESAASLAQAVAAVAAEAVQALAAQVRAAHCEQRFLWKTSEERATGLVCRT